MNNKTMKPTIKVIVMMSYMWVMAFSETIAINIGASNYEINQYATYTFSLQRYLDPIASNFIDPVQPVSQNSIIRIVFPNDYI